MTHTYTISGMTCSGCVARVKKELLQLENVTAAEIQLAAPQATITMKQHINTGELQSAVSKAGHYTIKEEGGHHAMPAATLNDNNETTEPGNSYYPIVLIFGYITVITLLVQLSLGFEWMEWMRYFMAGFFLVFSFFKLMNIQGFAEGYGTYDIVAKKIPAWGWIYPFVELGLGIAFLLNLFPQTIAVVTLVVMSVSSIGVIQSLLKKQRFQCACLGTIIKLPLSKVTLFEDLLMVAMSVVMLAIV